MYSARVSRRALLALCSAIGLGGCVEGKASKIAKDPYLPTMMQDPLYTWVPAVDVTRTEIVSPRDNSQLASGTSVSRMSIRLICRTPANAADLLAEAQQVATTAGYVNDYRVAPGGLRVHTTMGLLSSLDGIVMVFLAPA